MVVSGFKFAQCPDILFGSGVFHDLPEVVGRFGNRVLLVTGASSLKAYGRMAELAEMFDSASIEHFHVAVRGEPSPEAIDGAVSEYRSKSIDVVLAVGGGSAIDAGKAISAMLLEEGSVSDYLEDVGNREPGGKKVPFVAVPTTAGTGSEATKNSVLSEVGPYGFKVSLRHDNFVPNVAVVDPELTLSCPMDVTAACGMDAFTQLLESYVSTGASPITDALALSGMEHCRDNLIKACGPGAGSVEVRAGMSYASLVSGMTLANAGLGVVHGFAAAIGGLFEVPHGVVCGTLLGSVTRINIESLKGMRTAGKPSLTKYAKAGSLIAGGDPDHIESRCVSLIEIIEEWTEALDIPRLGEYDVKETDIDKIVERTSLKNNPASLGEVELREILLERL